MRASYTKSLTLSLIDAAFTIVELILGLRLILKFFGANPAAPFVNWLYATSTPL
ncbi:MAG: hypothetical protein HYZ62_00315, partial [Candidatus Andersenbacteria bacterium]|nr:hypothetical protein [Candidatus Andersenbacteria bacterium]